MPETDQPDSDTTTRRARPHRLGATRERQDRTLGGLTALLDARPDLQGVHAPADWAYDAVRWSV